jgi:hypothetical protein
MIVDPLYFGHTFMANSPLVAIGDRVDHPGFKGFFLSVFNC